MGADIVCEPAIANELPAERVLPGADPFVAELNRAMAGVTAIGNAASKAANDLAVNMLSANAELVQAHRQLRSVLSTAEVKQRAGMERFEKQSRQIFLSAMVQAALVAGLSAGIGAAIGAGITALLLR